jgi:hypothetical protein
MPLSTYARNALLGHVAGQAAYAEPTLFVALSTTAPNPDGTSVTEPTGGAYARVASAGDFGPPTSGSITNTSVINFPTATADWSAGAAQAYAVLYDAATAGNMIGYGAFTVAKAVLNGDSLSLNAGGITISMT